VSQEAVITKFPQVDHDQATGEIREVYEDIHSTLRLPWVAFGIRVMSQFQQYVPRAWAALKPNISTNYAEHLADRIRQAAIVPIPAPPDPRPQLYAAGWTKPQIDALHVQLDALNYGNPKYLVLITAWNEAWHGRDAGGRGSKKLDADDAQLLPYGLPKGIEKMHLVDPDEAPLDVQQDLAKARDLFLHHGPASDYRVLANWPDYLKIAAESLAPVALSAEYDETARRIRKIARDGIKAFASVGGVSRTELSTVLSGTDIAGLTGLLFMYNRFIPDITIAIIRLKQAFDGEESAKQNKFPV
jgi:hypothetical protein